jgi:hypothetical protein
VRLCRSLAYARAGLWRTVFRRYRWPEYIGNIPVTHRRFKPERGKRQPFSTEVWSYFSFANLQNLGKFAVVEHTSPRTVAVAISQASKTFATNHHRLTGAQYWIIKFVTLTLCTFACLHVRPFPGQGRSAIRNRQTDPPHQTNHFSCNCIYRSLRNSASSLAEQRWFRNENSNVRFARRMESRIPTGWMRRNESAIEV